MTVSVVIPAFNAKHCVLEAVHSALRQSSVDVQVILIDDGSTDGTAAVVSGEYPEVTVVSTENRGPSAARNEGTALATGDFVQYLDADDLLSPGKLEYQVLTLEQTCGDVAYGDWQRSELRSDGTWETRLVARRLHRAADLELFDGFWCPLAAYLFRRTTVSGIRWSPRLPIIQDARFAFDCALSGARFVYTPGLVAEYRKHTNSTVSTASPTAFTRDVYRNAKEIEEVWRENGGLTSERTAAVVNSLEYVARSSWHRDRQLFELAFADLNRICGRYIPRRPRQLKLASILLGYRNAVRVASGYAALKRVAGFVV